MVLASERKLGETGEVAIIKNQSWWQASFLAVANLTFQRLAQAGRHEVRTYLCGFLYSLLICLAKSLKAQVTSKLKALEKLPAMWKPVCGFSCFLFGFPLSRRWYCLGNYLNFKLKWLGFLRLLFWSMVIALLLTINFYNLGDGTSLVWCYIWMFPLQSRFSFSWTVHTITTFVSLERTSFIQ